MSDENDAIDTMPSWSTLAALALALICILAGLASAANRSSAGVSKTPAVPALNVPVGDLGLSAAASMLSPVGESPAAAAQSLFDGAGTHRAGPAQSWEPSASARGPSVALEPSRLGPRRLGTTLAAGSVGFLASSGRVLADTSAGARGSDELATGVMLLVAALAVAIVGIQEALRSYPERARPSPARAQAALEAERLALKEREAELGQELDRNIDRQIAIHKDARSQKERYQGKLHELLSAARNR